MLKNREKYNEGDNRMEKQIKLFLEFLQKDKKLSNNTLQSYKRDIVQFSNYIEKSNISYSKL